MCCVLDVCPCSRRSTKCLYLCEKIIALWHNWLFKLTHPGCVTKHSEFCGCWYCCNPGSARAAGQGRATSATSTGATVLTLQCQHVPDSLALSNPCAVFLQENTEYLLQSHPPLPLKILPRHIPCLTEALPMLNCVTRKGPLPRHTEKVPGSHQEVDCFILTELCLGAFFWNNHFWLMCKAGKLRENFTRNFTRSANPRRDDEDLKTFKCKKGPRKGVKNSQPSSGCLALCSTEP